MIKVKFYFAQDIECMCIVFPPSLPSFLLSSFLSSFSPFLPPCLLLYHKYLLDTGSIPNAVLGWAGSRAQCVWKPGTSGLGHDILQRVNPQVTRSQINSAPPNMPQSSLVTACWTRGSSLALISPASVLGQAAIFHLLKTDDLRVREMKAPFNRSAWDSAGKEGEGQCGSSILARTGPEHVL